MKTVFYAIALMCVIIAAFSYLRDPQWDVVHTQNVPSPYADNTDCTAFTHRNGIVQTICFDDLHTFLGMRVSEPVYYIQDGVIRLF
jgi:hypothetical protein